MNVESDIKQRRNQYFRHAVIPRLSPEVTAESGISQIEIQLNTIYRFLCELQRGFCFLTEEERCEKAARLYRIRWRIREITGDYSDPPDRKEVAELLQLDKHNPTLGESLEHDHASVLLLEATRELEEAGNARAARRFYELIGREFRGTIVGTTAILAARDLAKQSSRFRLG